MAAVEALQALLNEAQQPRVKQETITKAFSTLCGSYATHSPEYNAVIAALTDAVDRVLTAPRSSDEAIDTLVPLLGKCIARSSVELLTMGLLHALSRLDCKDRFIRLRGCCMLGVILESLPVDASVPTRVWDAVTSGLLVCTKDKIASVRAAAVRSLSRLQAPDGGEACSVQQQLVWLLHHDTSKDVRIGCVSALLMGEGTREALVTHTRDAAHEVRAAVYAKLASQLHVRQLTPEAMCSLLSTGLTDSSPPVRNAAVLMLCAWLWEMTPSFDVLRLLDALGIQQHERVAEMALFCMFEFAEGPEPSSRTSTSLATVTQSVRALTDADEEEEEGNSGSEGEGGSGCQLPAGVSPSDLWRQLRASIDATTPSLADIDVEGMFYLRVRAAWLSAVSVAAGTAQLTCKLSAEARSEALELLLPQPAAWADLLGNVAHAGGMMLDVGMLSAILTSTSATSSTPHASLSEALLLCLPSAAALAGVSQLPHPDAIADCMLRQCLIAGQLLDYADEEGKMRALSACVQLLMQPAFPRASLPTLLHTLAVVLGCGTPQEAGGCGTMPPTNLTPTPAVRAAYDVYTGVCGAACEGLRIATAIAGGAGTQGVAVAAVSPLAELRAKGEAIRQQLEAAVDAAEDTGFSLGEEVKGEDSSIPALQSELESIEDRIASMEAESVGEVAALDMGYGDSSAITVGELTRIYWLRILDVCTAVYRGDALIDGAYHQRVGAHTLEKGAGAYAEAAERMLGAASDTGSMMNSGNSDGSSSIFNDIILHSLSSGDADMCSRGLQAVTLLALLTPATAADTSMPSNNGDGTGTTGTLLLVARARAEVLRLSADVHAEPSLRSTALACVGDMLQAGIPLSNPTEPESDSSDGVDAQQGTTASAQYEALLSQLDATAILQHCATGSSDKCASLPHTTIAQVLARALASGSIGADTDLAVRTSAALFECLFACVAKCCGLATRGTPTTATASGSGSKGEWEAPGDVDAPQASTSADAGVPPSTAATMSLLVAFFPCYAALSPTHHSSLMRGVARALAAILPWAAALVAPMGGLVASLLGGVSGGASGGAGGDDGADGEGDEGGATGAGASSGPVGKGSGKGKGSDSGGDDAMSTISAATISMAAQAGVGASGQVCPGALVLSHAWSMAFQLSCVTAAAAVSASSSAANSPGRQAGSATVTPTLTAHSSGLDPTSVSGLASQVAVDGDVLAPDAVWSLLQPSHQLTSSVGYTAWLFTHALATLYADCQRCNGAFFPSVFAVTKAAACILADDPAVSPDAKFVIRAALVDTIKAAVTVLRNASAERNLRKLAVSLGMALDEGVDASLLAHPPAECAAAWVRVREGSVACAEDVAAALAQQAGATGTATGKASAASRTTKKLAVARGGAISRGTSAAGTSVKGRVARVAATSSAAEAAGSTVGPTPSAVARRVGGGRAAAAKATATIKQGVASSASDTDSDALSD